MRVEPLLQIRHAALPELDLHFHGYLNIHGDNNLNSTFFSSTVTLKANSNVAARFSHLLYIDSMQAAFLLLAQRLLLNSLIGYRRNSLLYSSALKICSDSLQLTIQVVLLHLKQKQSLVTSSCSNILKA